MLQAVGTWELDGSSYRLGHSTHAALTAGSVTLRKQEEKTRGRRQEGDVSAFVAGRPIHGRWACPRPRRRGVARAGFLFANAHGLHCLLDDKTENNTAVENENQQFGLQYFLLLLLLLSVVYSISILFAS